MDMSSLRKPLFGKEVEIAVWNIDPKLAEGVLEDAYMRGRELERIFNLYDKGSVLSELNRKRTMKVPQEMIIVMRKALELCKRTEGRYDISLGKQFLARKSGKEPGEPGCSYKDVRIKDGAIELTHEDVLIDLGSIAKGYIADEMAKTLIADGVLDGLIDARGDIRTFGEERALGVQHPRENGDICKIKVKDSGVATSGDYNQYDGSFDRPHILNNHDFISVTAIGDTLMEADGYATAIFVTPKGEIDMLLSGSGIKAMCVGRDLAVSYHNGFERCIA
jgi:FAD:protein FMN transferase